ncbi:MAG: hypothetical protein EPN23_00125 [Verrucomicrobia bacterium]|nr:MAG: hypothetical protein EPN23_00125 [Verrucomicrobiota bacterium]
MKKVLWMLVLAAFVGFGATQGVMAKEKKAKGEKPVMVTINGTVKVAGDDVTIVADDATYTLAGNPTAVADYKAKDGQKVEVKGIVKEKDGKKELIVGAGKGGHKKKEAAQ